MLEIKGKGVIPKLGSAKSTSVGFERILSGEFWMPESVLDHLVAVPPETHSAKDFRLTERQQTVVDCLAEGLPNKKIAKKLCKSEL